MYGVFKFLSFLAIYYILATIVDAYGTYKTYKSNLNVQLEDSTDFELSSNLDLLVASVIYLMSYYSGIFDS